MKLNLDWNFLIDRNWAHAHIILFSIDISMNIYQRTIDISISGVKNKICEPITKIELNFQKMIKKSTFQEWKYCGAITKNSDITPTFTVYS